MVRGIRRLPICRYLSVFHYLSIFVTFPHISTPRSVRRYPHGSRQQADSCDPLLICSARSALRALSGSPRSMKQVQQATVYDVAQVAPAWRVSPTGVTVPCVRSLWSLSHLYNYSEKRQLGCSEPAPVKYQNNGTTSDGSRRRAVGTHPACPRTPSGRASGDMPHGWVSRG